MELMEFENGKIAGILFLIILGGFMIYGIATGDMNFIRIEGATL